MDSPTLISALLTIAVGAIAGGITNAVAIWMLFHPYESRGLGPFRIQGAIPKNKSRLAKSIGKTVGEKLLSAEDLTRRLAAPEVRAGFDGALSGFLDDLLERERGPLLDQLPPDLAAQLEAGLDRLAARASEQLAEYAEWARGTMHYGSEIRSIPGTITSPYSSSTSKPPSVGLVGTSAVSPAATTGSGMKEPSSSRCS